MRDDLFGAAPAFFRRGVASFNDGYRSAVASKAASASQGTNDSIKERRICTTRKVRGFTTNQLGKCGEKIEKAIDLALVRSGNAKSSLWIDPEKMYRYDSSRLPYLPDPTFKHSFSDHVPLFLKFKLNENDKDILNVATCNVLATKLSADSFVGTAHDGDDDYRWYVSNVLAIDGILEGIKQRAPQGRPNLLHDKIDKNHKRKTGSPDLTDDWRDYVAEQLLDSKNNQNIEINDNDGTDLPKLPQSITIGETEVEVDNESLVLFVKTNALLAQTLRLKHKEKKAVDAENNVSLNEQRNMINELYKAPLPNLPEKEDTHRELVKSNHTRARVILKRQLFIEKMLEFSGKYDRTEEDVNIKSEYARVSTMMRQMERIDIYTLQEDDQSDIRKKLEYFGNMRTVLGSRETNTPQMIPNSNANKVATKNHGLTICYDPEKFTADENDIKQGGGGKTGEPRYMILPMTRKKGETRFLVVTAHLASGGELKNKEKREEELKHIDQAVSEVLKKYGNDLPVLFMMDANSEWKEVKSNGLSESWKRFCVKNLPGFEPVKETFIVPSSTEHDARVLVMPGAFNPLHEGHLNGLRTAYEELKKKGDVIAIVLLVADDQYVRSRKIKSTPDVEDFYFRFDQRIRICKDVINKKMRDDPDYDFLKLVCLPTDEFHEDVKAASGLLNSTGHQIKEIAARFASFAGIDKVTTAEYKGLDSAVKALIQNNKSKYMEDNHPAIKGSVAGVNMRNERVIGLSSEHITIVQWRDLTEEDLTEEERERRQVYIDDIKRNWTYFHLNEHQESSTKIRKQISESLYEKMYSPNWLIYNEALLRKY